MGEICVYGLNELLTHCRRNVIFKHICSHDYRLSVPACLSARVYKEKSECNVCQGKKISSYRRMASIVVRIVSWFEVIQIALPFRQVGIWSSNCRKLFSKFFSYFFFLHAGQVHETF